MNYPEFFVGQQINPALINDIGENNVAQIARMLKEKSKLNINQLRKFYDSFVRIYDSQLDKESKKVQLLMLKANVEYSAGRLKIIEFANFFKDRVNTVLNQDENFSDYMYALKLHLEALVAYFPKKNN